MLFKGDIIYIHFYYYYYLKLRERFTRGPEYPKHFFNLLRFDFIQTGVQTPVCLRKKIPNSLLLLISHNINLTYFEICKVEGLKESRHRYACGLCRYCQQCSHGKISSQQKFFFSVSNFRIRQNRLSDVFLAAEILKRSKCKNCSS